jgi:hypothetical protein
MAMAGAMPTASGDAVGRENNRHNASPDSFKPGSDPFDGEGKTHADTDAQGG